MTAEYAGISTLRLPDLANFWNGRRRDAKARAEQSRKCRHAREADIQCDVGHGTAVLKQRSGPVQSKCGNVGVRSQAEYATECAMKMITGDAGLARYLFERDSPAYTFVKIFASDLQPAKQFLARRWFCSRHPQELGFDFAVKHEHVLRQR